MQLSLIDVIANVYQIFNGLSCIIIQVATT